MQSEQAVKRLEDELHMLENVEKAERATDRRSSILSLAVASCMVLVLIGFLLANFLYFKSEWTEEKFAKSLQTELGELNPVVMEELRTMGQELLPVYAQEGRKQLPGMAPTISKELSKQLVQFSSDFQADAYERLDKTEDGIRFKTRRILYNAYPDLKDSKEKNKLTANFMVMTDNSVACSIDEFRTRFSKDADAFQRTLQDLNVADSDELTIDLQKKFIRLWLQLLDEEIMKL